MAEKEKVGFRLDVPDPDGSDMGSEQGSDGGDDDECDELGMRSRYHSLDTFACFKC